MLFSQEASTRLTLTLLGRMTTVVLMVVSWEVRFRRHGRAT